MSTPRHPQLNNDSTHETKQEAKNSSAHTIAASLNISVKPATLFKTTAEQKETFFKVMHERKPYEYTDAIYYSDNNYKEDYATFILPLLSESLGIRDTEIASCDRFETAIIQHARQISQESYPAIDINRDIIGQSEWMLCSNGYLHLNYHHLSIKQAGELAAVYRSYYGDDILRLFVNHINSYELPKSFNPNKPQGYSFYFDTIKFAREVLPNLTNPDYHPVKILEAKPNDWSRMYPPQVAFSRYSKPASKVKEEIEQSQLAIATAPLAPKTQEPNLSLCRIQ